MTSTVFRIKEHTLECQHIREYPRATACTQEDVLKLAIKQYIPLDNLHPQQGDITIIGAHANGYPKELYEPLWEDLHARSRAYGFKIRSIWIADLAHQGASSVMNEQLLGDDPSWLDHARDLLHMVNTFRKEMPLPIVGIGHSFGANQLTNLSYMHPRLLTTLVMLDPVINEHPSAAAEGPDPNRLSTYRRDIWPTRAEAEASFRRSPAYESWDPRALNLWCQHAIRPTPTTIHPTAPPSSVTLTTTKHQECFSFMRPSWPGAKLELLGTTRTGLKIVRRDLVPDIDPNAIMDDETNGPSTHPFYRPEPLSTFNRLPTLRPSVLYIYGGNSTVCTPRSRFDRMKLTGQGVGGSHRYAKEVVLDGHGHLIAQECPALCADAIAPFLGQEMQSWREGYEEYVEWTRKSLIEKQTLSKTWEGWVGPPYSKDKNKAKVEPAKGEGGEENSSESAEGERREENKEKKLGGKL